MSDNYPKKSFDSMAQIEMLCRRNKKIKQKMETQNRKNIRKRKQINDLWRVNHDENKETD